MQTDITEKDRSWIETAGEATDRRRVQMKDLTSGKTVSLQKKFSERAKEQGINEGRRQWDAETAQEELSRERDGSGGLAK